MTFVVTEVTPSSRVDKLMDSHRCIFTNTFDGIGGIPSAIVDVGSFNNIDGLLQPSESSSEDNVGMSLVLKSGLIGSMGIPDVSVRGPRSKISGEQLVIDVTRYYRFFLSYVAVWYTIEHLAICD